jgi:5-methylcytosine-specific restriction endonuclease McrA
MSVAIGKNYMDNRKKSFAIAALRRASYRWPSRFRALANAKIGRNEYLCKECGTINPKKQIQLDHIEPCVPVTGWDGFDGFIDRMFTDTEAGFQVLCKSCHLEKSQAEAAQRKTNKKS